MKGIRTVFLNIYLVLFSVVYFGFFTSSTVFAKTEVSDIYALVNKERVAVGMTELVWNEKLATASDMKAKDMIQNGYWAHISPSGITPWDFITAAKYRYQSAGENLAKNYNSSTDTVSAWMTSPTHKANMLSKKYKDTGIGIASGKVNGVETEIIVQMFGSTSVSLF